MDAFISLNRKTLDEKLAFSDEDFERWMASLQLLFLGRVFSCGGGGEGGYDFMQKTVSTAAHFLKKQAWA